MVKRRLIALLLLTPLVAAVLLYLATLHGLRRLPDELPPGPGSPRKAQILDRGGQPLTVTYQNEWNVHERVPLHAIPEFLQQAFVLAEDRRFYRHDGVDWRARIAAVRQNLLAGRAVRGASTISEQVVKLLHQRPRTLWSRWLEGFEARRLEQRFSKSQILEFYLNQVPFAAQRRGVVQAAHYYFDRDLATLSQKEMLALAVLIRAPTRLDPYRSPGLLERRVSAFLNELGAAGLLDAATVDAIRAQDLQLRQPRLPVDARHFVSRLYRTLPPAAAQQARLYTTLDAGLQAKAAAILAQSRQSLAAAGVRNAALIVVEHGSGDVLAYASAHDGGPGSDFDAAAVPRQPGSTLKPFVYALALEQGWTAATLIDDSPLVEAVGQGLHAYRNYSRSHYGPVRLRDALGNSLNIPAVRAVQYVGPGRFLERLRALGITSLTQHPDHYGDGLALGNGEITLWELAGAYAALARGGEYRPLRLLRDAPRERGHTVFSPEVSTLIGDILADPGARQLEFGQAGLMRFPVQTAIKTGTSSDYRDAWAVGFNHRYTVAAWMGSLDGRPMNNITGARGPVLVLRSVFAELTRNGDTAPLPLSPRLIAHSVCRDSGTAADGDCASRIEYFLPGTAPAPALAAAPAAAPSPGLRLRQPSWDLQLAMDPRIPDAQERFRFLLDGAAPGEPVEWFVDGERIAVTTRPELLWPLARGAHQAWARVGDKETSRVPFRVK